MAVEQWMPRYRQRPLYGQVDSFFDNMTKLYFLLQQQHMAVEQGKRAEERQQLDEDKFKHQKYVALAELNMTKKRTAEELKQMRFKNKWDERTEDLKYDILSSQKTLGEWQIKGSQQQYEINEKVLSIHNHELFQAAKKTISDPFSNIIEIAEKSTQAIRKEMAGIDALESAAIQSGIDALKEGDREKVYLRDPQTGQVVGLDVTKFDDVRLENDALHRVAEPMVKSGAIKSEFFLFHKAGVLLSEAEIKDPSLKNKSEAYRKEYGIDLMLDLFAKTPGLKDKKKAINVLLAAKAFNEQGAGTSVAESGKLGSGDGAEFMGALYSGEWGKVITELGSSLSRLQDMKVSVNNNVDAMIWGYDRQGESILWLEHNAATLREQGVKSPYDIQHTEKAMLGLVDGWMGAENTPALARSVFIAHARAHRPDLMEKWAALDQAKELEDAKKKDGTLPLQIPRKPIIEGKEALWWLVGKAGDALPNYLAKKIGDPLGDYYGKGFRLAAEGWDSVVPGGPYMEKNISAGTALSPEAQAAAGGGRYDAMDVNMVNRFIQQYSGGANALLEGDTSVAPLKYRTMPGGDVQEYQGWQAADPNWPDAPAVNPSSPLGQMISNFIGSGAAPSPVGFQEKAHAYSILNRVMSPESSPLGGYLDAQVTDTVNVKGEAALINALLGK